MTEEEIQELKDEMRREMMEEMYEEQRIRTDLDYALEKLGIADIHQACEELADKLCDYGYDISTYEVIEYLEEI